jgi:hypothetical protein
LLQGSFQVFDACAYLFKICACPGIVAGPVCSYKGKGNQVHAAVRCFAGVFLIHVQAAGSGGNGTAGLLGELDEVEEARMQKRLAPALQVGAG